MKKILLITLLAPAFAQAYQSGKTYHITILHTNDTHGRFWPNDRGEYGMAAHQTLVKQIRQEVKQKDGTLLVLSAGDINTGVPESDVNNARPDIEAMNAIGYEAMALGNHEFDNPLQMLGMQEKWAKFPFISANVRHKKTGRYLTKPYVMFRKKGLRIAVVGLTTEETASAANLVYTQDVVFDDVQRAASKTLKNLKHRKPDIKIALTHLGYLSDIKLADALPPKSFDMIIGGHSHTTVCVDSQGRLKKDYRPGDACQPDYRNGTWIMQAGEWSKYLGRADFTFKDGKLNLQSYRLIPVNLKYKVENAEGKTEYVLYQKEIPQDEKLAGRLKKYQDEADKKLSIEVGSVNGKLEGDRSVVRYRPSNLGRLIARAQRERTGADVSVMNGGGIRDSIQAGKVSYKDILRVQPFGNIISYVGLTGSELREYLQTISKIKPGSGGYPQFDNVSFDVDKEGVIGNILIGGKPLKEQKVYRLALSDFLANGGDHYPKVADRPSYVNTGFVDADVLKLYFERHSPIDASQFEK